MNFFYDAFSSSDFCSVAHAQEFGIQTKRILRAKSRRKNKHRQNFSLFGFSVCDGCRDTVFSETILRFYKFSAFSSSLARNRTTKS